MIDPLNFNLWPKPNIQKALAYGASWSVLEAADNLEHQPEPLWLRGARAQVQISKSTFIRSISHNLVD